MSRKLYLMFWYLYESPPSGKLSDPDSVVCVNFDWELETAQEESVHPNEKEISVIPFHWDQSKHWNTWKNKNLFIMCVDV
jgi:hypothetical protein